MEELLKIIPAEENDLRVILSETDYPREALIHYIGWPTDQWHWDALSLITGKTYEQLQAEMEPED